MAAILGRFLFRTPFSSLRRRFSLTSGDLAMFGRNQVSDKDLLKAISQRLARTGTSSQSKVNVAVQQGNVTLSGTLQHAIQRSPIVKTVTRVAGVRRVVDQMQHVAKKRLHAHGNGPVRR